MEQIPNKIKTNNARTVTLVQEWALEIHISSELFDIICIEMKKIHMICICIVCVIQDSNEFEPLEAEYFIESIFSRLGLAKFQWNRRDKTQKRKEQKNDTIPIENRNGYTYEKPR